MSCVSPEAVVPAADAAAVRGAGQVDVAVTSRLLLEVGQSLAVPTYQFNYQPENGPVRRPELQHATSVRTVGVERRRRRTTSTQIWNTVANVSYVTGSHNFKAGVNQEWGYDRRRKSSSTATCRC